MELTEILSIHSIGDFKIIEVIEIIGIPPRNSNKSPFNIFTIAIAQDLELPLIKDEKLISNPIQLRADKSLKFGIFKSILSVEDFLEKTFLLNNSVWENSKGNNLACGRLKAIPSVFVPVHYDEGSDFSGLLKNNFFNGSHVFEWFDESKTEVQMLIDNHQALIELSEKLQEFLPIELASHSDRLGNFIVQIPCSILDVNIRRKDSNNNNINFNVAVNPNSEIDLNRFTGIFWREERDSVIDFCKIPIIEGLNTIPFNQINGKCHYTIWDDTNQVICLGGKTSYFMESVAFSMNLHEHKSRILNLPNGTEKIIKVRSRDSDINTNVISRDSRSNKNTKDYRKWVSKQMIKNTRLKLHSTLKLRQFKENERNDALKLINELILKFGSNGIYLWDPFLSAEDILETICLCPYSNVHLKALTSVKGIRDKKSFLTNAIEKFKRKIGFMPALEKDKRIEQYKLILDNSIIKSSGLSLTFLKSDNSQCSFHDRFIIFPTTEDCHARAWSLGTSVNSLGKSHHIIQEVEDAQIIEDVFDEMWQRSNKEENIIWQSNE